MYIIAEAGINHNGSLIRALDMVEAAKECGADAVKFQCFWHWKDLKEYKLSRNQFIKIFDYAKHIGIDCFASPFSFDAIDFLKSHQRIWKVPSGFITHYDYLKKIGEQNGTVILSTGMSTLEEVETAVEIIRESTDTIYVLHCTTEYPCKISNANLLAIKKLQSVFGKYNVGFSDHTPLFIADIAAVGLGVQIIEKHFTLDRNLPGPDQKASLEPIDFKAMVWSVRLAELAMGSGIKKPTDSEMKHRGQIRARMSGEDLVFEGYKDGVAVFNT